jgi:cobalt-zinc-cadmium efflux system membrane fusion protein
MRSFVLFLCFLGLLACSHKPAQEQAEEPKSESKLIKMTVPAQEHVGLQTVPAAVKNLQEHLHVVGTVQPIDTRIGQVRPLARGRVQEILVRVGDRVQAGQVLATFDNIEAGEVLAQYQGAIAELKRLKLQQVAAERIAAREKGLSDLVS